jgi:hypothetical protein
MSRVENEFLSATVLIEAFFADGRPLFVDDLLGGREDDAGDSPAKHSPDPAD